MENRNPNISIGLSEFVEFFTTNSLKVSIGDTEISPDRFFEAMALHIKPCTRAIMFDKAVRKSTTVSKLLSTNAAKVKVFMNTLNANRKTRKKPKLPEIDSSHPSFEDCIMAINAADSFCETFKIPLVFGYDLFIQRCMDIMDDEGLTQYIKRFSSLLDRAITKQNEQLSLYRNNHLSELAEFIKKEFLRLAPNCAEASKKHGSAIWVETARKIMDEDADVMEFITRPITRFGADNITSPQTLLFDY